MKYLFITILVSILFVSCSKKTGNTQLDQKNKFAVDTAGIKTSPVSNPNETFNLTYKFGKDKHYQYRLSSFTNEEQTTKMDSSVTQKINRSVIYIMDASQVNEEKDGAKELECEITSIKFNQNVNGNELKFVSGSKMDSAQIAQYTEFYALLNSPFGVRLGSNGGVLEIFKVDKIIDKYTNARGTKVTLTPQQKEQLKSRLIEGILKPIVAQVFREMPQKSLSKDSTWNVIQPPAQYLVFKIDNADKYKIDEIGKYNNDKLAVIDAGLQSTIEGKTDLVQNKVTYHFNKPETTTSGKIYFNITKGCIQKSKINTKLHFRYSMEGMTPQGKKTRTETESLSSSNIVELL